MTAGWSGGLPRETEMPSIANLHQLALSVVGALVASSLFISAAVPVVPIV